MSLTYTWKLKSLKKTSTNALQDVIVQTHWECTGTDSDGHSGTFHGATPFDLNTVDPAHFTVYSDLTEETVLGWIQAVVVDGYKEHIDQQIQKQIDETKNPVVEVQTDELPWATPANTSPNTAISNTTSANT